MLDAPRAAFPGWQEVPGSVLVGTHKANDLVTVRFIDLGVRMLKEAQWSMLHEELIDRHVGVDNVAFAKVLDNILTRRWCTPCGVGTPERDSFCHASQLIERIKAAGKRNVNMEPTAHLLPKIEVVRKQIPKSLNRPWPGSIGSNFWRDNFHWIWACKHHSIRVILVNDGDDVDSDDVNGDE